MRHWLGRLWHPVTKQGQRVQEYGIVAAGILAAIVVVWIEVGPKFQKLLEGFGG